MFRPVGEISSSEVIDFDLSCYILATDSQTSISRHRHFKVVKHMANKQNGCMSRCYWLIEMHLILND